MDARSLASNTTTNLTITVTAPLSGSLTNTVASTATATDFVAANNNGTALSARVVTGIYPIPTISGARLPGGEFQLQFVTIPGSDYTIEASTNLVEWITLLTTNTPSGNVSFTDPDTTNHPVRFYRSKQGQ